MYINIDWKAEIFQYSSNLFLLIFAGQKITRGREGV